MNVNDTFQFYILAAPEQVVGCI